MTDPTAAPGIVTVLVSSTIAAAVLCTLAVVLWRARRDRLVEDLDQWRDVALPVRVRIMGSRSYVTLVVSADGTAGVEHGGCDGLAMVFADLDVAWCEVCHWQERVGGAEVLDLTAEVLAGGVRT